MSDQIGRYAIYFVPEPDSALARFGARWLGYDVASGADIEQPVVAGMPADRLRAITGEPRRYGFHATLKPPFALANRTDASALADAVAALADGLPAFLAPPLRVECIAGFLALTPSGPSTLIDTLANACVRDLDGFRAPPTEAELARRRQATLSPRQKFLLAEWGYPYVFDEFRFHMTLTARLDAAEGALVERALTPLAAPFCREPLFMDAIALLHQQNRGGNFLLLRRYPLRG